MLDKLVIGLDYAPPAFDLRSKLLGSGGCNLEYIKNETGVAVILKGAIGNKSQPLYFTFIHDKLEAIEAAKILAKNLIDNISLDLNDFFKNNPPTSLSKTVLQTVTGKQGATVVTNAPPTSISSFQLPSPAYNPPAAQTNVVPAVSHLPLQSASVQTPLIPQTTNFVALQPQTQILQVLPNQQVFVAQDGTQYIQVKVTPNSPQVVAQNQIVLPQNMALNGTLVNVQPLNISHVQAPSLPVVVQANMAIPQSSITSSAANLAYDLMQASVGQTVTAAPPAPVPPPPEWFPDKQELSQVNYIGGAQQTTGDNIQWSMQVNSQTSVLRTQQPLVNTPQVSGVNFIQDLPPPQKAVPWIATSSESVQCQFKNKIGNQHNLPSEATVGGSLGNNTVVSSSTVATGVQPWDPPAPGDRGNQYQICESSDVQSSMQNTFTRSESKKNEESMWFRKKEKRKFKSKLRQNSRWHHQFGNPFNSTPDDCNKNEENSDRKDHLEFSIFNNKPNLNELIGNRQGHVQINPHTHQNVAHIFNKRHEISGHNVNNGPVDALLPNPVLSSSESSIRDRFPRVPHPWSRPSEHVPQVLQKPVPWQQSKNVQQRYQNLY